MEQKKKLKTWHITLIVIASIILLIMIPYLSMQIEMQMVVRSREVRELIDYWIKKEDPKYSSEEAVIKNYKIDYSSINHNPMGGIWVTVYINEGSNEYINFLFVKDHGYLDVGGMAVSPQLSKELRGKGYE